MIAGRSRALFHVWPQGIRRFPWGCHGGSEKRLGWGFALSFIQYTVFRQVTLIDLRALLSRSWLAYLASILMCKHLCDSDYSSFAPAQEQDTRRAHQRLWLPTLHQLMLSSYNFKSLGHVRHLIIWSFDAAIGWSQLREIFEFQLWDAMALSDQCWAVGFTYTFCGFHGSLFGHLKRAKWAKCWKNSMGSNAMAWTRQRKNAQKPMHGTLGFGGGGGGCWCGEVVDYEGWWHRCLVLTCTAVVYCSTKNTPDAAPGQWGSTGLPCRMMMCPWNKGRMLADKPAARIRTVRQFFLGSCQREIFPPGMSAWCATRYAAICCTFGVLCLSHFWLPSPREIPWNYPVVSSCPARFGNSMPALLATVERVMFAWRVWNLGVPLLPSSFGFDVDFQLAWCSVLQGFICSWQPGWTFTPKIGGQWRYTALVWQAPNLRDSSTGWWSFVTLQGTNISPKNGILKMIFLFPRWDMLISWRVSILYFWLLWYVENSFHCNAAAHGFHLRQSLWIWIRQHLVHERRRLEVWFPSAQWLVNLMTLWIQQDLKLQ